MAKIDETLGALRSRGEIKAFGKRVDRDPTLKKQLLAYGVGKRLAVDESMDGRRLVRTLLNRAEEAQVRKNPIRLDGGFKCVHCGADVAPGGARVRDHCPVCLHGQHVDNVPGDRASPCQGLLVPTDFVLEGRAGVVITFVCATCQKKVRNRAHPEDALPVQHGGAGEAPVTSELPFAQARTLPKRVLHVIRKHQMWQPDQRVVVGVSGGLDSTVLLEVLAETQGAHKGDLQVRTVDHGLRPSSTEEAAQVMRHAQNLGLSATTTPIDLSPGPNLYVRARTLRRAALSDGAPNAIALAHHQDDQAETVLAHLLRGSGSRGLRGMQPRDGRWVRPLLFEPRAVLQAWAHNRGIRWIEDPSNPTSRRGQMRALWPALDALQGDASGSLARSARLLAREDALLDALTDEAMERYQHPDGVLVPVLEEHPALVLRVLRRLTKHTGAGAVHLEPVLGWAPNEGSRLPLPGGWCLRVRGGVLVVVSDP